MTISQNDVRLYASERMTDNTDGGGRMVATVIVDGADNNCFDDIPDLDRVTGRTSMRKLFGAVTSVNTDRFLSAFVVLTEGPADVATSAAVFSFGGYTDERAAAAAWLSANAVVAQDMGQGSGLSVTKSFAATVPVGGSVATFSNISGFFTLQPPTVGDYVTVVRSGGSHAGLPQHRRVLSVAVGITEWTLDNVVLGDTSTAVTVYRWRPGLARCYGLVQTTALASTGTSSLTVNSPYTAVVPIALTANYAAAAPAVIGINAAGDLAYTHGRVPVIADRDAVLIHHTLAMAPAAVANSQVVPTGRTTLARLRVLGNNGVEHARFTRGVPAPSGVGCTADLDAGTVTFTDVSGMSQPVTVDSRIEELAQCVQLMGSTLTINRPLARTFPSGARVSSLLLLGDMQARVTAGFAQTAWTGVWSDARIGGEPSADYNEVLSPIVTTNAGGVTDRWYLLFTNTTSYRLIGERLGEVGTGNTGVDFSPVNPISGAPYMTVKASGFSAGWAAGNIYRFNTYGAQAGFWPVRCVVPSVPGGSDSMTPELRGYVNI